MSTHSGKGPNNQNSWFSEIFRLVLIEDETLKEIRSTRLSGASLFSICMGTLLISSLLGAAVVMFTPMRHLVPGFGDVHSSKEYRSLSAKLDTLENEMEAQQAITRGFRNLLNPSQDLIRDISNNDSINRNSSINASNTHVASKEISIDHYYFWPPVNGRVSAPFDVVNKHFGVDVVAEKESPVLATLGGVVIAADWNIKTGNTISIQHDQDLVSVYKHNSSLTKNIGESVSKGEVIAIIGNSGILTSGPHVHFELWHRGEPVDPENYIVFKS